MFLKKGGVSATNYLENIYVRTKYEVDTSAATSRQSAKSPRPYWSQQMKYLRQD